MFEEIYDDYVREEARVHSAKREAERERGWFSASSAGSCFKQQFYNYVAEAETDTPGNESLRKMRLGTVMHKEFEKAMKYAEEKNYLFKYFIEYPIELPNLMVKGTLDCAIYNEATLDLVVADWKTIGSYPYKLRFGREKSKNKSKVSTNYELQCSTYTEGLLKVINKSVQNARTQLIFYNKDTSRMKTMEISPYMREEAIAYWEDLNDFIDEEGERIRHIKPNTCVNVPAQQWECNYCRFESLCKTESE